MRYSFATVLAASLAAAAPAAAAPRGQWQPRGQSEGFDPVSASTVSGSNHVQATSVPSTASSLSTTMSSASMASSSDAMTPSSPPSTATLAPSSGSSPPTAGGYRNVLYFTNWGIYKADYQPDQIPTDQVTHVLYAFADIQQDGTVVSSDTYADLEKHYPSDSWDETGNNAYGCVKQLYLLKKKNRNMKVLLSIGGWTYSPKFAPVATTDAGRKKFCSSATQLVGDWGFDGIDIDWEYPTNSHQAKAFTLLLQECRQSLDAYGEKNAPGYHFDITIASPAGPSHYQVMDLEGMNPNVDAWNLMAYDYAGSWDNNTGHQANIYDNTKNQQATPFNTDQAVKNFISRSIPAQNIMMGLPIYGRSFEATSGLGKPYTGVGAGSSQAGIWLYKDLPKPGAQVLYDNMAKASYSYDNSTQELISFDTVGSAKQKAGYLKSKGLGGAVFWEGSGDKSGADSLVGTLASEMGALQQSQNLLSYPASQYDNIKKGMA